MFFFNRGSAAERLIRSQSLAKIKDTITADNCNQADSDGHAPLYYAIEHGRADVAAYLLSLGCNPDTGSEYGEPIMVRVVNRLDLPLAQVFIDHGFALPDYINGLPLLHHLLRLGDLLKEHLAFYVDKGFDINLIDERATDKTALAFYLGSNEPDINIHPVGAQWLIELGADVNKASRPSMLPISQAMQNSRIADSDPRKAGLSDIVEVLLAGGQKLDIRFETASNFYSLVDMALKRERYESFVKLAEFGIPLDDKDREEARIALDDACFNNGQVARLISANERHQLALPLSIFLLSGRAFTDKLESLNADSPDMTIAFHNLVTGNGFERKQKLAYLELLLKNGADINAQAQHYGLQLTPIQLLATSFDNIEHNQMILDWLLANGAKIECHGRSALHIALWFKQDMLVSILADKGADLFFTESDGATLLSRLVTPDPGHRQFSGTALASNLRRLSAIYKAQGQQLPLEQKTRMSFDNPWPLDSHLSLIERVVHMRPVRFIPVAEALIDIGWPINKSFDYKGETGHLVNHWCFSARFGDDISEFLQAHPELDISEEASGHALRWAIMNGVSVNTIGQLALKLDDINQTFTRKINGLRSDNQTLSYPMLVLEHHAIYSEEDYVVEVLNWFIDAGIDLSILDKKELRRAYPNDGSLRTERTLLEHATSNDYLKVFKLLLDRGADPHQRVDKHGETVVHFLLGRKAGNKDDMVLAFLKELDSRGELDPNQTDLHNPATTPLMLAAGHGLANCARFLLEKGGDPHVIGGFDHSGLLHKITSNTCRPNKDKRRELMEMMLDEGLDPNVFDTDQETVMMSAARYGCETVIMALLERQVDPNLGNEQKETAVYKAVTGHYNYDTYPDVVEREWPDQDMDQELKGRIIERLAEAGADLNVAAEPNGFTALLAAVRFGHLHLLETLLRLGANVDSVDNQGRTALALAVMMPSTEVLDFVLALPEAATLAKIPSNEGNNLLHYCTWAQVEPEEMTQRFIQLRERFDLPFTVNLKRQTPLHYAAFAGNEALVRLCIDLGADVNLQDVHGYSPLHCLLSSSEPIAETDSLLATVSLLITAGSDPRLVNQDGETPLQMAADLELNQCLQLMTLAGVGKTFN
ncbi:ankyrin repeat domain-containing protein [Gallaecimonas mangrovi]|uniref:ankyrin repeat domain-containing protein n=1 Tax=Gallaecimonas mangrovi TaxID=2291597 RepID=UPI000E1FE207|nr:ankyrin repeat domain-containing protein [Gallaecimonas mangrovi]